MRRYLSIILLLWITAGCKETTAPTPIAESIHLSLGNPTNAKADTTSAENFLMLKEEFAISYNRTKRHANWVAWELSKEWLGSSDRQDNFRPDPALPGGWYKAVTSDYTGSGFDRGHLCPSADRTSSDEANAATFLMTNIIPQAPALNRESWAQLEEFCRSLAQKDYRLYIIAGTYGTGGEGSAGTATTIRNGINVSLHNYKVIVAIPGGGGIEQVSANTPVIAVDMPNRQGLVDNKKWTDFITTPEDIEKVTGARFFTNLPQQVRDRLRAVHFNPATSVLQLDFEAFQAE
ncbi:DNA/RNA non-specific endonuclease [Telluribacter sp. SYSU D00476]|uniref:DNA/RNA non-specific endonuclease n=1 Tax=Telluribacter sp. SYSU D00476 TaxID=2811430 RepID=UPI001FF55EF9|nr:DNA/RNA non-specific endonuclease [Telluribacter sp. SYSU D00476]